MSRRIYVYKVVVDNGGAPCVHGGVLSLAICKPKIRRTAAKGDFLIGFGGKRLAGRLIYAAEVTAKPPRPAYYVDDSYSGRPDRIYRSVDGLASLVDRPKYHKDGTQVWKDVGARFENADVLISSEFVYLGSKGNCDYQDRFPALALLLSRLRQGHRVNHPDAVQAELEALIEDLWRRPKRGAIGKPCDRDLSLRCNRDRDEY